MEENPSAVADAIESLKFNRITGCRFLTGKIERVLRRLAREEPFDLVILDVMLPSLSGFEVLRRLRHSLSVPVIMLTAHGADVDRIVGLELGADDYLSKPFNARELESRLEKYVDFTHSAPGTSTSGKGMLSGRR